MRLRSLQIKGFKSFANDTVLNFEEDVIGVVGPNGSGKSNIVDAIRWVLGEQKGKELRLDKMSDVIFNGTKSRKKAGVAQVSLTFDNTKNIIPTEYQSVTVSRLLYRSGESEYRLNNVPCRLKDIRSLFIDTGIGSNSYAIIALGMVDDILADKDHARRRMFEQASGISKYKTRKKETLNKLRATTEDLDRIEDLLFEIENNLKTLEKQAKRTKKYFELKEKYRDLSIQFSLRSISTYKEDYKIIKSRLNTEEEKYRTLDAIYKNEEAALESIKGSNLTQEEDLSTKQKDLNNLVTDIRNEENRKNLAIQRLGFKNEEITKIGIFLEKAKGQTDEIEKQIIEYNSRFEQEKLKLNGLSSKTTAAHQTYETKKEEYHSVRSELDAYSKKKESLSRDIYEKEKSLAISQNNRDNILREINEITVLLDEASTAIETIRQEYQIVSEEVTQLRKEIEIQEKYVAEKLSHLSSLENSLEELKNHLSIVYRKKDATANEYDLLKSMVDAYEGFPESIKYLSKKWNNTVPILSDILEVEEEFKAVIEQYLKPYLDYFIVDDISAASHAISLLSEAQKGKASFFLLDRFKNVNSIYSIPEHCIQAHTIVKIDEKYRNILDTLLRNVYIYTDVISDPAILDIEENHVVLSASGNFILKGGELSGGSVGLFEGKRIGRKKNLEKLEKLQKELDKDIGVLQARQEEIIEHIHIAKKNDIETNLNALNQKLKVSNENLFQIKYRLDIKEQNINQYSSKTKVLNNQLEVINKTSQEDQDIISKAKAELTSLSNGKLFSDEEIDELNHQLNQARDNFNALNIEKIRQQNLVENIEKDVEIRIKRKEGIQEEEQQNQTLLKNNNAEIEKLREEINGLEISLSNKYTIRDEKKSLLNEAEKIYYSARNTIHEKEDEVRKLNRSLNQSQVIINQLKDEFNEIKFKISGVGERLKIEFDIILNDIINDEVDDELPFDVLELKVTRMKTRLANFGEINPMAVAAYDEMKERYDTINGQRTDILEAKESLLQTIQEIENTATKKYMEAFSSVRENFIKVFRSLFTEDDTCDLILLDETKPLESDIEIIAKPKGKKPKGLNQLSGGEKTLTATALLFALYLLKPAPFCIFDEVDAPLDDANIQKFNKIISNFSNESQFIIVTHNKSTMAAVDVLYGVYMQEQGVSAVTPVDFRNYDYSPIIEAINN